MSLAASCPRCTSPVTGEGRSFACLTHGRTDPLWRPDVADYDTFAELVGRIDDIPTYLPWPMSPGWTIADFGCVGDGRVRATVTTTVGTSDLGLGLAAYLEGAVSMDQNKLRGILADLGVTYEPYQD